MSDTKESGAPQEPLTLVIKNVIHSDEQVQVKPLDTVNRPWCPEDEQVEVVLKATSFDQCLNTRQMEKAHTLGRSMGHELVWRERGDRFYLDVLDLPRHLKHDTIVFPEELEAEQTQRKAREAEEAKQAAREAAHQRELEERREQARSDAAEHEQEVRARRAAEAAEQTRELDAEIAEAAATS